MPQNEHTTREFTARILTYMRLKNYHMATGAGEVNIVYVEGCDPDGRPNADALDRWNDLRIVIVHDGNGTPQMMLCEPATTEPGYAPTHSAAARKRGGVARIAFGQYAAWKVGFHKYQCEHPALVQVCSIPIHRDANRDGLRTGDPVSSGLFGINQHGTRPNWKGDIVANWSEGCSVGRDWVRHLYFVGLCKADPRYQADPEYIFRSTWIDGSDLERACPIT